MEGTIAVLIPFGFMAMIAAIVIAPRYFRSQERQKMADLMRAAIERGQPVPPEVIEAIADGALGDQLADLTVVTSVRADATRQDRDELIAA